MIVKIEQYGKYRCRIEMRTEFCGNKQKPGMSVLEGREVDLQALWRMGDDDPYPGEWAMGKTGYISFEDDPLRYGDDQDEDFLTWIASGDVAILSSGGSG